MARSETYNKWLEAGYELYAREGSEGLQIEKLARLLNLNKSGFYHYFGDFESFCKRLIVLHEQKFDFYLNNIRNCQQINPDFLNLMLENKLTIMAQTQMLRNKNHPLFEGAYKKQEENVGPAILHLWIPFTQLHNNPALSLQHFGLMRDMFYSRITWDNFNFNFLQKLSDEISDTVIKILGEGNKGKQVP